MASSKSVVFIKNRPEYPNRPAKHAKKWVPEIFGKILGITPHRVALNGYTIGRDQNITGFNPDQF